VSQTSLLIEAVRALDSAGVGYMLTGSLASSIQGEPRATHDIDLVIEVDPRVVDALANAFGTDAYYFDDLAARDALGRAGMFNLIDTASGDKIDFWALTDDPFDQSRFDRRVRTGVFGAEICVSAPEDTVLQKLRWSASVGVSERQLRDAAGVYQVQQGALDEGYLDRWAKVLGLEESLSDVRRLAQE
jgi:hypothetical protein